MSRTGRGRAGGPGRRAGGRRAGGDGRVRGRNTERVRCDVKKGAFHEQVEAVQRQPERTRLSKNDPALKALNALAEILESLDRAAQLKALAAACVSLGMLDDAERFIRMLREE
jgi:hypothetical protein